MGSKPLDENVGTGRGGGFQILTFLPRSSAVGVDDACPHAVVRFDLCKLIPTRSNSSELMAYHSSCRQLINPLVDSIFLNGSACSSPAPSSAQSCFVVYSERIPIVLLSCHRCHRIRLST
jgi:hypothetical protein